MLSPYRISANNNKKRSKEALNTDFNNNSHHEPDKKRPQMTSIDLKRPLSISNEKVRKQKQKTIEKEVTCKRILKLTNTI